MLNKIEKLEKILNRALESIGKLLVAIWLKVVPVKILNKLAAAKLAIKGYVAKIRDFVIQKLLYLKGRLSYLKGRLQGRVSHRIQDKKTGKDQDVLEAWEKPPLKQKALEKVGEFKSFLLKTPLRGKAEGIANQLTKLLERLGTVPKTQALIAASAMLMIFFGTYSVYVSSEKIYMKEWGSRAPASADEYLKRPEYLKYKKRTLKVFNVKIPVYVESVKSIQSVTVDFTVRTETRFARQFLEEYEYKLKDYFFMTTEPMTSTFPLEEEGKMILKDKIKDELNIFLDEEKVEGEVLDVDIIFIIGS